MKRYILDDLKKWATNPGGKPLILRGARQVGKTWAVRELAAQTGLRLLEINFERNPEYAELFDDNDPKQIISQLEVVFNTDIDPACTLLFLDEIQEASRLLSKLRWFYEEMPQLKVVAAGSLLEFVLEEHDFSMPVGRVSYMYMMPMSFAEFLLAKGEDKLLNCLQKAKDNLSITDAVHEKATALFREYTIVGGMPSVVSEWVKNGQISACSKLQKDLLQTYRDDFNKYRKSILPELLRKTMESVAMQLGCRFMYSNVNFGVRQQNIKKALDMLALAGLCTKVYRTAANGLPLGAEKDERLFKVIFLDTGLLMNLLGYLPMNQNEFRNLLFTNRGALAEQLVGQALVSSQRPEKGQLYYWQQSGSGTGEIDYIISRKGCVVPVEVKAGASGSMKSLHGFMGSKNLKAAIRFDLNKPSLLRVDVKTNQGKQANYELRSYPLYMTEFV